MVLLLRQRGTCVVGGQDPKYEIFASSFGPRAKIAPKSVPRVSHGYFSLFNQSNHRFVVLSLPFPSSFVKVPDDAVTKEKEKRTRDCMSCQAIPELSLVILNK